MEIVHNKQENRFEIQIESRIAKIEYAIKNDKIYLVSTQVPEAFKGQGVGSKLVRETLSMIEKMEMKIVPVCSFIQAWFKRHPEKAYLLAD
ncbi:MAG: N-acetyltransferase [Bacteroidetes bacterium]|nr:N-acetyltransferase [Bacteroidota bacterium]